VLERSSSFAFLFLPFCPTRSRVCDMAGVLEPSQCGSSVVKRAAVLQWSWQWGCRGGAAAQGRARHQGKLQSPPEHATDQGRGRKAQAERMRPHEQRSEPGGAGRLRQRTRPAPPQAGRISKALCCVLPASCVEGGKGRPPNRRSRAGRAAVVAVIQRSTRTQKTPRSVHKGTLT
jgi:hypothetical protein